jgi:hypothetical protein
MVIFPLVASTLAWICCFAVLYDYLRKPKPAGIAWVVAFAIFGAAASIEVVTTVTEWTPLLARAYYVLGATLVVGYLALGQLYLIIPRRWSDRFAGVVIALSALAVSLVVNADVAANVADDGWHALDRSAGLTVLTIGFNVLGTLVIVGGCLYSALAFRRKGIMRNRMIGCLLIAAGTLSVASGGTLTRLGSHQYLYIAMTLGIALIFTGYMRARQPDTVVRRAMVAEGAT